jgi:hypothetical protein
MIDMALDEALRQRIQQLGNYLVVDFLRDGTIIGMGDLAVAEYAKLQTGDDEPTGWIARRGR